MKTVMRAGGPADEDVLLGLLGEAVAWMLTRGQEGQWGADVPSETEAWRTTVRTLLRESELHVIEAGGRPAGAVATGSAPAYVSAPTEPELYVLMLVTARSHAGQGVGARLLETVWARAREQRVSVVRVDCWAGAPGLVGWYERQGFLRTETFERNGWRGRVLEQAL